MIFNGLDRELPELTFYAAVSFLSKHKFFAFTVPN